MRSANEVLVKSGGGLYINEKIGEKIFIEHNGEILTIILCGICGKNTFKLGFQGALSFKVTRDWKKHEKSSGRG